MSLFVKKRNLNKKNPEDHKGTSGQNYIFSSPALLKQVRRIFTNLLYWLHNFQLLQNHLF